MPFINETDMVNRYLWEHCRQCPQWKKVRLGKVNTQAEAYGAKVLLRWADAVYIDEAAGRINIIEAKLRPDPSAIGQLELYSQLIRETPEFSAYADYAVQLISLNAMEDLEVRRFAESKGIKFIVMSG
ncbi:MAG: hypothetical protein QMD85_03040 [Candidatus Aenigmarchaeota archaeon]|nr:hypothetical protein [Candidatus Aenigmarchaeota archaeon]